MTDSAPALAAELAASFRRFVLDEYVPRIRRCVELLDPADAWRKPGPHGNSVCNLLLHLEGNVRQWILAGIGGAEDRRERSAEFAATVDSAAAEPRALVDRLEETAREAVAVVERLDAGGLLRTCAFQGGRWRESALYGVVHVLEHFSGHAGQIYAFTKQVTGTDLRFYDL